MYRKPRKTVLGTSQINSESQTMEFSDESNSEDKLLTSLATNLSIFQDKFNQSPDLIVRHFLITCQGLSYPSAILFIDGLIDKTQIENSILSPLMIETVKMNPVQPLTFSLLEYLQNRLLTVGSLQYESTFSKTIGNLLAGNTALLIDGYRQALNISTPGWERRSLAEPETEVVIRGPRQGFTETLRGNTVMLRRIINHQNITFENMKVGQKTQTMICIAYLKGLPSDSLITELKSRLNRINTDAILGSGYIEQFIEDAPLSFFPTVGYTERPDVTAAKILEGRIAILVDGTPFALTIPSLFIESFQSPDDYNFRPLIQTVIRWLRYLAVGLAVLSPAIYVALTTYHQELIPTPLLLTMMSATAGIPFPSLIEVLGLGIVFEILQEAGVRLPRPIGQTISIVGALVIGQATVAAGLVSAPVVIVVAITAIASYVTPAQSGAVTLIRFGLVILAGLMGAFGIMLGILWTGIHLTALRSFGIPYLAPLAPRIDSDLKDVLVRAPIWTMFNRPRSLKIHELQRQASGQMPKPEQPQPDDNKQ